MPAFELEAEELFAAALRVGEGAGGNAGPSGLVSFCGETPLPHYWHPKAGEPGNGYFFAPAGTSCGVKSKTKASSMTSLSSATKALWSGWTM